jgi:excisionase family DNA binding protein
MKKDNSAAFDQQEPEFYSTREAAVKLGLSLGTVQKMVETGALSAWKTSGGHRRVLASSLSSYMRVRQSKVKMQANQHLSVLVVEDDKDMQKLYALNFDEWGLNIRLHFEANGLNALLHIAKHRPDIVITDLHMPNLDGFEMINSLRNDASFSAMDILVVTGMNKGEISERGGLPKDVMVFAKPVSFATLQGYVTAKEAAKARAQ